MKRKPYKETPRITTQEAFTTSEIDHLLVGLSSIKSNGTVEEDAKYYFDNIMPLKQKLLKMKQDLSNVPEKAAVPEQVAEGPK